MRLLVFFGGVYPFRQPNTLFFSACSDDVLRAVVILTLLLFLLLAERAFD